MINIENPLIKIWYTRFNNKMHDKIIIYILLLCISLLNIKVYTPQSILVTENFENFVEWFLQLF